MKSKSKTKPATVSRRRIIQLLATLGITGPAAIEIAAQKGKQVTPEMLKSANILLDHEFDEARLRVISTALQQNLGQFQSIRDLIIDDTVEPAPVFLSRGRP